MRIVLKAIEQVVRNAQIELDLIWWLMCCADCAVSDQALEPQQVEHESTSQRDQYPLQSRHIC
jgi:hypothetical protein